MEITYAYCVVPYVGNIFMVQDSENRKLKPSRYRPGVAQMVQRN